MNTPFARLMLLGLLHKIDINRLKDLARHVKPFSSSMIGLGYHSEGLRSPFMGFTMIFLA